MNGLFLGIDTSNYKTSAALIDQSGNTVFERSEFLEVPKGGRGLRQSEAFFRHSNRLPEYLSELFGYAYSRGPGVGSVRAVGVSDRPRRAEGSYMPCFLAGLNAALETGAALGIPVYRFSHQEGHAAAVIAEEHQASPCIFMHLSGGTTEFLICEADEAGYSCGITGGTKDISLGQLLDRTGVALGFPFPSGAYLDDRAYRVLEEYGFDPRRFRDALPGVFPKLKYDGGFFNLSGAETKILRYLDQQRADTEKRTDSTEGIGSHPDSHKGDLKGTYSCVDLVIAEIFYEISKLLITSASELSEEHGLRSVYMAGGVASSRTVRRLIGEHFSGPEAAAPGDIERPFEIHFGKPELSGDNAVGTARLAVRIYSEQYQRNNEAGNSITGK